VSFNIPICQQYLWNPMPSNSTPKQLIFVIHWSLLAQMINILDARSFHKAHNNFENQLQMLIAHQSQPVS